VFVLGVIGAVPGCHSASRGDVPTLTRTIVLDGLDGPWDLAFTPDGGLLFTEKCRGLSVRRADGSRHFLFGRDGAAVAAPAPEGHDGAGPSALDRRAPPTKHRPDRAVHPYAAPYSVVAQGTSQCTYDLIFSYFAPSVVPVFT
jgi:glucose/arabinose dehydrogenase